MLAGKILFLIGALRGARFKLSRNKFVIRRTFKRRPTANAQVMCVTTDLIRNMDEEESELREIHRNYKQTCFMYFHEP